MKKIALVIGVVLSLLSGLAIAHSGGTDRAGCHKNHKTGDYHCH